VNLMADKDFKVKNGIDVAGNANIDGNLNAATIQQSGVPVVTTTSTQELTNKTLTSPTISSPTISGTITGAVVTSTNIVDGTITGTDVASGTITSTNILDGTIVNADINASAAIASTKISGTAATLAGTETLTNKTLTSPRINENVALTATSTFLNRVDATSSIQTQLNGKQATISGGASTIASTNLTASRALVSDASGKVAVSAVTAAELAHLDNVTSAIQTQLNGKKPNLAVRGGSVSITPVANTMTSGNVSWGVTMPSTPFVAVSGASSSTALENVSFSSNSTTGCTVWIKRTNTTSTTCHALAISNT
jgi:hypothetical protein